MSGVWKSFPSLQPHTHTHTKPGQLKIKAFYCIHQRTGVVGQIAILMSVEKEEFRKSQLRSSYLEWKPLES